MNRQEAQEEARPFGGRVWHVWDSCVIGQEVDSVEAAEGRGLQLTWEGLGSWRDMPAPLSGHGPGVPQGSSLSRGFGASCAQWGEVAESTPTKKGAQCSLCMGDGEAAPFVVCSKMGCPRGYSVPSEKSWTWRCFPGREGSLFQTFKLFPN